MIDFNNQKGSNLGDPKFAQDAVNLRTLQRVAAMISGDSVSAVVSGITAGNNISITGTTSAITVSLISSVTATSINAGTILSAGTDLYSIFITQNDGNDITRVQPGTNTYTAGTGNLPSVNISGGSFSNLSTSGATNFFQASATTLSGGTIFSANTNLYSIFAVPSSIPYIQNGLNTYTGGTFTLPTVNVSALTINTLNTSGATTFFQTSATSFSASSYFSGSTPLENIINNFITGVTSAITNSQLQNGLNTYTGGTTTLPFINISGGSFNNFSTSGNTTFFQASATTLSASTILIQGIGSTSATTAVTISNSASTHLMTIMDNGNVNIGNYSGSAAQRIFTVGQNGTFLSAGNLITSASTSATTATLYLQQTVPSSTNYTLFGTSAGQTVLNGASINFRISDSNRITIGTGGLNLSTGQGLAGTPLYQLSCSNNSNQTVGTNIPKMAFTLGTTSWSTGALPHADFFRISQPGVLFTAASTATTVSTFGIDGAPTAGTNSTLFVSSALHIKQGIVSGPGTVATSFGAYINAQSGATFNYAIGAIGDVIITGNTFVSNSITASTITASTISATTLSANTIVASKRVYNIINPSTIDSATTIDWSTNNIFDYTLTAATTFTFSNVVPGQTTVIAIRQPYTGATGFNYSYSGSNVFWQGGLAPTITTATGKTDIYTFISLSASSIYGSVLTNF